MPLNFVPLGGVGEIGMNLAAYECDGEWLAVDCGVLFRDPDALDAELILPDPSFLAARRDKLVGLVLTHAHEDHIGALPLLWPRLGCPVFATPFAAAVLRRKMGGPDRFPITTFVPDGGSFTAGPFRVDAASITHSIPEPTALFLRTRYGTVVHTGDWKLDPEPLMGEAVNSQRFIDAGDEGVLALVCDSTNAMVPGVSGSEGAVRWSLIHEIGRHSGRVVVTLFASNLARIESVARAALVHDRSVALVGRSLRRMVDAAREARLLRNLPPFVSEADAGYIPPDRLLMLVGGCQGEPRGALNRIATEQHPQIALDSGDSVLFSSRTIPGNEAYVAGMQDLLKRRNITVVTADDSPIHCSGHPAELELREMYRWLRPKIAVPVHGEAAHIAAHAKIALEEGVQHAIEMRNGQILHLAPGTPTVEDTAVSGRLAFYPDAPKSDRIRPILRKT
jgi:ribonuclease J